MTEQEPTREIKTSALTGKALEWAIGFAEFFEKVEKGTIKTRKIGPGRYVTENQEDPKVWDTEKILSVMNDYRIGVFEDDGKWFAAPSLEIVSLMEGPNGGVVEDKPHLKWLQSEIPFLFEGGTMTEAVKRCYVNIIHPFDSFDVPLKLLDAEKD